MMETRDCGECDALCSHFEGTKSREWSTKVGNREK